MAEAKLEFEIANLPQNFGNVVGLCSFRGEACGLTCIHKGFDAIQPKFWVFTQGPQVT